MDENLNYIKKDTIIMQQDLNEKYRRTFSKYKEKEIEKDYNRTKKVNQTRTGEIECEELKESLQIPQVSTKPFSIKPLTELDTTINIVKTKEEHLKIPKFNLAKFTLSKITNLDTAILIEQHETDKKLAVPQLILKTFKPISKYSNLDTKFEITTEQSSIKVPQLLSMKFKQIQPYERFLIDRPVQQLKSHPKVTSEERVKGETAESTAESSSESEELELEEFEPFNLIFSLEGGTFDFDEPLIICLEEPENDSYIGTVRTLCKLIYREKVGGLPEPIIIESFEELKDELRWIKAEHRIFSVKLNKKEWRELTNKDWVKIWSRIKQLFAQGFGVIIFNKWLDYIGEHSINIVKLKPKNLPPEIKKKIVELFWGVRVSDDDALKQFDLLFETARKKKDQLLKRLERLESGIYWDATKEDENESKEHRLIKALIVRLIVKELRKRGLKLNTPTEIEKYVKTEYWVSDKVRADVYADRKVFEIETLFAEDRGGKTVRDKLRETFRKYENTDIKEINVILDNPTFIRHIGTILSLLKNHKDWMKTNQKVVKFYTIDTENERLIPLEDVMNKLKDTKNIQSSVS